MRFLIDRCAGAGVARFLRESGHDVVGPPRGHEDPGDEALLRTAAGERRILVTLDADFGALIFLHGLRHSGLVRLPDVPVAERTAALAAVLHRYDEALRAGAVVTVRGGRIRVSRPPPG